MKNNAIITWASGNDFCKSDGFKVFVNSILKAAIPCDKVVLTHEMDQETNLALLRDGFEVVHVDVPYFTLRERWMGYYNYLCENLEQYDNVLISDSKDVIFQRNPFGYYNTDCVYFASEGGLHGVSEWNTIDQAKFQMKLPEHNLKHSALWEIVNGGFILGPIREMKDLCLLFWTAMLKAMNYSDQAAINYLVRLLIVDEHYKIMSPSLYEFCLTGEGVKRDWLSPPPIWHDNKVCRNRMGESPKPYLAFHQWERTLYKDAILEIYK